MSKKYLREVQGHTGGTTPPAYWQELAQNRAALICKELAGLGVKPALLVPRGAPRLHCELCNVGRVVPGGRATLLPPQASRAVVRRCTSSPLPEPEQTNPARQSPRERWPAVRHWPRRVAVFSRLCTAGDDVGRLRPRPLAESPGLRSWGDYTRAQGWRCRR